MEFLVLILPFLDKFLSKCLDDVSSESPKDYLRAHYDAESGTMDQEIVEDAMPQTRRAIRRAHSKSRGEQRRSFPKYSTEQVYKITEDRLVDAMKATEAQLSEARAGAAAIPDED